MLAALYWAAPQLDLSTLVDGGYEGAGIGVHTPLKQPAAGREMARAAPHHRQPRKFGDIVKAALVLTHFSRGRLT